MRDRRTGAGEPQDHVTRIQQLYEQLRGAKHNRSSGAITKLIGGVIGQLQSANGDADDLRNVVSSLLPALDDLERDLDKEAAKDYMVTASASELVAEVRLLASSLGM